MTRVAVCVTTFNQFDHKRDGLFQQCLDSIHDTDTRFDLFLIDNGSTDRTRNLVSELGGYRSVSSNTTSAAGTNLAANIGVKSGADIVVLSDDDVVWETNWLERTLAWWQGCPDDIWLTGLHWEPQYEWNKIEGTITSGGQRALVRRSTGAATWSFRSDSWPRIGPLPQKVQGWGDVPACQKVWAAGGRICQLGLATHAGEGKSIWGNQSQTYGEPLDLAYWGVK